MTDISIVIPSYNTKKLLDECLASIYNCLEDSHVSYEIIVVDNASKDSSVEMLNKKYTRVIKILNKENVGYGKANNQAIQKAKGEYILLLNSDISVVDDAIETLYSFAKKHSKSFCGGRLINRDGSSQSSGGPFFHLPVVFGMLFLKGDQLGLTRYSPREAGKVDWVSGACLIGKKELFLDVGLFDENIFMYMDEVDFLYRANKKGYTTYFDPSSTFIHEGAASSGSTRTPVINIYKGLYYFYYKHATVYEQALLVFLLKLKAWIVIGICRITGNSYLKHTYEKALQMV